MLIVIGFWTLVSIGIILAIGFDKVKQWWVRTILGMALFILAQVNLR